MRKCSIIDLLIRSTLKFASHKPVFLFWIRAVKFMLQIKIKRFLTQCKTDDPQEYTIMYPVLQAPIEVGGIFFKILFKRILERDYTAG